jgi:hypothetical protein
MELCGVVALEDTVLLRDSKPLHVVACVMQVMCVLMALFHPKKCNVELLSQHAVIGAQLLKIWVVTFFLHNLIGCSVLLAPQIRFLFQEDIIQQEVIGQHDLTK